MLKHEFISFLKTKGERLCHWIKQYFMGRNTGSRTEVRRLSILLVETMVDALGVLETDGIAGLKQR
jgi:hypothetical protein